MSAAEARALCANLRCIDEDIAGDHRARDALGRWLIRFTPVVSCGWDIDTDTDTDMDTIPTVLFLDLTGSERLFGGIDRLVDRVKLSLVQFGIPAQIALAPTPGAAWAFALTGGRIPTIIDSASLLLALPPLPIEALRLDEAILGNLHHLGLHRVGDVLGAATRTTPLTFWAFAFEASGSTHRRAG